jgi:hypothetical protein
MTFGNGRLTCQQSNILYLDVNQVITYDRMMDEL